MKKWLCMTRIVLFMNEQFIRRPIACESERTIYLTTRANKRLAREDECGHTLRWCTFIKKVYLDRVNSDDYISLRRICRGQEDQDELMLLSYSERIHRLTGMG